VVGAAGVGDGGESVLSVCLPGAGSPERPAALPLHQPASLRPSPPLSPPSEEAKQGLGGLDRLGPALELDSLLDQHNTETLLDNLLAETDYTLHPTHTWPDNLDDLFPELD